jgi:hypothetical protein
MSCSPAGFSVFVNGVLELAGDDDAAGESGRV